MRRILDVVCAGLLLLVLTMTLFYSPGSTGAQIFATNTPPAADPLRITPAAPLSQYALRLWTEPQLIEVLLSQLARLSQGQRAQARAVPLTLHELQRRFSGAPTNLEDRGRILAAMVKAGGVDMRSIARPYLVARLNERMMMNTANQMTIDGFRVEMETANLDGEAPMDAVLYLRYPETGPARYEEYLPVLGGANGYELVPVPADIEPVPFSQAITQLRLDDVNQDGVAELALSVDRGGVNRELVILGWRSDRFTNLAAPGESILFGEIRNWPLRDSVIEVYQYQTESVRWDCVSQIRVTWRYRQNSYRPEIALNERYNNLNTLGCEMLESEPVFAQPAIEAIPDIFNRVQSASVEEPGFDRTSMALATLYYLDQQTANARTQVDNLRPLMAGNLWLTGQINAFDRVPPDASAVVLCDALLRENPDGACDMDQILAQSFAANSIVRPGDVLDQLRERGLPIMESMVVSEVGRLDRVTVKFNLAGSGWWAFAPTEPDRYVPEQVEPPYPVRPPVVVLDEIVPPASAYTALVQNNNPVAALNALDNLIRDNPGVPISAEARYMQALSYDLLANRQQARESYFLLWRDFPNDLWGQLAGVHLEQR